jgi:hypothetical protein
MRIGPLFARERDCEALAGDFAKLMTGLVAPATPEHPIGASYFCNRVSEAPDSDGRYTILAPDGDVSGYLSPGGVHPGINGGKSYFC